MSAVNACLIVDDVPSNATHWARFQQSAFGFRPSETGWGANWPALQPAALFRVSDMHAFADLVEEFGIRGKFTLLPCPAGLGRIDCSVRGYADADLKDLLAGACANATGASWRGTRRANCARLLARAYNRPLAA